VTKHGVTNRTLKQGGKVQNGRLPNLHDQKNSVGPHSQNNVADFLILERLFIMNLYQLKQTGLLQWKPYYDHFEELFDNNNRLITLSGGYKNLHCLTQFIFTTYRYKIQQNIF
jgi:hypothetical protein